MSQNQRKMVHNFIIQSLTYWLETFQISALRFDLMGLHDLELMNKVEIITKRIDEKAFIYGEGWNIGTILPTKLRANMENAALLPNIAFFNDVFRDKIKGGTFSLEKGYSLGGKIAKSELYYLFTGSSLDNYKFFSPSQSINYLECHDNHTFYDRAKILTKNLSEKEIKDYARLGLSFTILSQGIPFIHSGQEFLRTKKGVGNSYRDSDEINALNWDLKNEHLDLVETVKTLITIRKDYRVFRLSSNAQIKTQIKINHKINKRVNKFYFNGLKKSFSLYFKNDYQEELLVQKVICYILMVRKKTNSKNLVVKTPGCYLFIKER